MDKALIDNITRIQGPPIFSTMISDDLLYWTIVIGAVSVNGVISLFGVLTNIINILVFVRQGILSDSSTVSLFGLAISDLMCEVTLVWLSICYSILYFTPADLPYDPMSMLFLTAGRPHVLFTQITRYMTLFISFERCVCVLFPFKVKTWFSPHKTAVTIASIYILIFLVGYFPMYVTLYLKWQKDPNTNRTILTEYQTGSYVTALTICSYLNGQVLQSLAILGVFVFTQITAIRVNVSRKWRKSTAGSSNQTPTQNPSKSGDQEQPSSKPDKEIGTKDKRLVKMIRVICIIFLICYTPDFIMVTAERIQPEIRPGGFYHNLFFFVYVFVFNLAGFNASINIFVYYRMSTRYRNVFRLLFGLKELKS